jgi:glycosyltransferase involved in cell wall biosynthesis
VVKAARAYPDWDFVLIGSSHGCDISEAQRLPNVRFLGEMPYAVLPDYVHGFDVCIIPFLIFDLTIHTNPVKLYEYLAAGKPVVGTAMPEIMIGGSGERKTLRLVAQYADACNLFATGTEEVAHTLRVLRDHCDDIGRDYAAIRKTVLYMDPSGGLDGFPTAMAEYAAMGVDEAIVAPPDGAPARWIERRAAPAARALAELG